MKITPELLQKIPQHKAGRLTTFIPGKITPFIPNLNQTMEKYKINTSARIAAFMAQAVVESACFTRLKEATNYTMKNAMTLWPSRFNLSKNSQPLNYVNLPVYMTRPDTIVNRAYAGKNGNSVDEWVGDGIKYAGRGIFQITGKGIYQACGISLQLDLINNPQLLEQTSYACQSAGWFWAIYKNLNHLADNGNIDLISKRVNGGTEKIADRRSFWLDFKSALESLATETKSAS